MITIIADSNISHLHDYFNNSTLAQPVRVITMVGREITAKTLADHEPHALLVRSVTQVNVDLLANNDSVKFVGSATIGTDHIDQQYLAHRGIHFTNAAGCSKHSVAQYALTAILNLRPHYANMPITLGIIGLGNIGKTLARYATDMGWHVLGYDPLLPPFNSSLSEEMLEINNSSFDELIAQSDVVSLHVPLTTNDHSEYPTYHLIEESSFANMKPTAMLINSARGQVVKESALLADIAKTHRQVVLDVFEYEPEVSAELLESLAIATPHIAGYTLEGKLRGTQMVYEAFCDVFKIEITQCMDNLLPNNPLHWQSLQSDFTQLASYYDIAEDGQRLPQRLNTAMQKVAGKDFDGLRKHYPLRREWVYDT